MISWPGTTHRGPPPPRDHWQGRAVCRDLFPWSIKSAPPVIPFDIPVTGMVKIAELARPYQNTNFGVDFFLMIIMIGTFSSTNAKYVFSCRSKDADTRN